MRGRPCAFRKPRRLAITATGRPLETRVGAEHLGRVLGLELGVIAGVEDAEDHVLDFVGQAMVGGQDAVQLRRIAAGRCAVRRGRRRRAAARKRWRIRARQSASSFAM